MPPESADADKPQAISTSPFATGGYGGRYESAVGGYFLSLLLTHQPLLSHGPAIERVAFQQGPQGALLDDVVLSFEDGSTIELSIKAGVKVQAANPELRETLERAWYIFRNNPENAFYGLLAPSTARGIDSLQRLAFLASEHSEASEFARVALVPGTSGQEHRERFDAVRTILDGANGASIDDATFHQFLRRLRVIVLDLNLPASTHLAALLTALQGFQGIDASEALVLYAKLVQLTQDAEIGGGAIDRPALIRRLRAENVQFGESRDYKTISDALRTFAVRSREAIRDDVAGTYLDRSSIIEKLADVTQQGRQALLVGSSGSGKSVILQRMYESLVQAGPVLYLTGRRIEASVSWQAICADIVIPPNRDALIELLATHRDGITVMVDGLEYVVTPAARNSVNDLLLACRDAEKRGLSGRFSLFMSMRDNSLHQVSRWLHPELWAAMEPIVIDVLSEVDAAAIAEHSPRLRQLLARVEPNPVTRNLLILRLLDDERIPESAMPQGNASEIDMLRTWWEHVLFTDDPRSHARLAIVYRMAEAITNASDTMVVLDAVDSSAVATLVQDEVLVRDPATDRYRFAHEILQDWSICRWLSQIPTEIISRLRALAHARYLQRPVSLLAQTLLELNDARYTSLLCTLRAESQTRWYRAFVAAIAASTRSASILQAREQELLQEEAALLRDLLVAMRTEYVDADEASHRYAESRGFDAARSLQLALSDPMPRFLVWAPLLRFTIDHRHQLPASTLSEFMRIADIWQRRTPWGFPFRTEIVDTALDVLSFLEPWRDHAGAQAELHIAYADRDEVEKLARAIVANSFGERPAEVREYIQQLSSDGYHDAQMDLLKRSLRLAMDAPEELVDFALSVLIDHRVYMPWELDMSEHGLIGHTFYPPSDLQGPFLALLSFHEDAGIRLVRELANHSVEHDMRALEVKEHVHFRPLRFDVAGAAVEVFGNEYTYCLFRPYSTGSSVLTSALMALETWAYRAINEQRDPSEVVTKLLEGCRSAAMLGIVVGLAFDFPETASHLTDVVASPAVWRLEYGRERMDHQARSDMTHLLPPELQVPSIAPEIEEHNKQRDAGRTTQRVMVRLSAWILFLATEDVREEFLALCATKTAADACLYIEEADNLDSADYAREQYRDFAAKVDPANFVLENGEVRWNPPAEFLPSAEEQQTQALRQAFLTVGLEALPLLRSYRAPSNPRAFVQIGRLVDQAVRDGRISEQEPYALDAIIRTAVVGLAFDADLVNRPDDFRWCLETVCTAARTYAARNWDADQEDYDLTDMRRTVGLGIAAAYCRDPANVELRQHLFHAATVGLPEVGAATLRGLLPLWETRASAPLNVLACLIQQALGERGTTLSEAQRQAFIEAETQARSLALPRLTPDAPFSEYLMKSAFSAMPRAFNTDAALELRPLLETLIEAIHARDDEDVDIELAFRVGSTSAAVLRALPRDEQNPFYAVLTDWQRSPELYAQMIDGFAVNYLNADELDESDVQLFERLSKPFLNVDHAAMLRSEYLPSAFLRVVQYMIFVEEFGPHIMPAQWAHAARFRQHIERWVRAVGGHPRSFEALTVFLERFATAFSSLDVLAWLATCSTTVASALVPKFWAQSGERCALLILRMLQRDCASIMNDQLGRERALRIANELLAHGVAAGAEIRNLIDRAT